MKLKQRNLLIIGGVAVAGLLLFMSKGASEQQTAITTYGGGGASTGYLAGEAQREAPITDARTMNYNIDLSMPNDIWGSSDSTGAEVTSTPKRSTSTTGQVIDIKAQQSTTQQVDIFTRTTASATDRFATIEGQTGYVADRYAQQSVPLSEAERRQASAPQSIWQQITQRNTGGFF